MCNKVRRLFRITFCAVVSIFILLSISSCSDLFFDALRSSTSNTGETVTFTGSINIDLSDGGALPEEYTRLITSNANHRENTYARYAIPAFPDSTPTTTVTATATGESSPIPTINGDTFTVGLTSGKVWTVTVTRKYSGGITLSDSATFDLTSVQVTSHDFVLKPDTSGTGNIELSFNISDDRIHYFTVDIENQDQIIYTKNIYSGQWALKDSSRYILYPSISIGSINSGVHRAVLRFYRNQDDDDKVLLCTLAQDINVFNKMTTNKWVTSNGDMVDDLEITETMVNSLTMKQIFVGNCGTGTATPSDSTGTGSPYSPFATLSRAIYAVSMLPGKDADDNTIPYTIHVKDGQTESWTSGKSIDNTHNVTIECWKNTVGDKLGTATVFWNGESNGTLLSVCGTLTIEGEKSEGENPTWSGLVFDGNKSGDHPASGISCDGGVLNLKGGGIQNCSYARTGPGAVYGVALDVEAGGTVNMSGGKIQQNTAGLYSGSYGAIYIASGADPYISTFNMTDGMICDNEHSSTNGYLPGIYISSGRFNMSGGEISRNIYRGELTGGGKGGAVYLYNSQNAVFNMSGGKLVGNVSGDGGAVYVGYDGIFRISGSAYIPAGDSSGNKGKGKNDVWVSSRNSCKFYIGGALAPPAAANGIVATITPDGYTTSDLNNAVIELSTDPAPNPTTTLPAECGKFAVTPNAGKNYVVNSDGKIAEDTGFVLVNGATVSGAVSGSNVFVTGRTVIIPSMYVCKHEVTQEEYQAIMGSNPSSFKDNPADGEVQEKRPVEQVSWYAAISYCNRRSSLEHLDPCYTIGGSTDPEVWGGPPTSDNSTWDSVSCDWSANGYRLPTEAEWEYIARGGNNGIPAPQTDYSGSNTADAVAWTSSNSNSKTHQVMLKAPNTLRIYDLSGNVYEWCWDKYAAAESINAETPADGPTSFRGGAYAGEGSTHVARGGSYKISPSTVSNSRDYWRASTSGVTSCGFRVVRTANTTPGS